MLAVTKWCGLIYAMHCWRARDGLAVAMQLAPKIGGMSSPEDIGISPSSEDAGNAVMAYARLHELDQTQEWLDLWKIAADYFLSWRKAYNVRFHPATMFAQADLRTSGGDFASNHNNHLHGYAMNCLGDLRALSAVLTMMIITTCVLRIVCAFLCNYCVGFPVSGMDSAVCSPNNFIRLIGQSGVIGTQAELILKKAR